MPEKTEPDKRFRTMIGVTKMVHLGGKNDSQTNQKFTPILGVVDMIGLNRPSQ